MSKIQDKKVKQITNFIINNITLAEVSAIVIEKATESAEFIVNNDLDPTNFDSPNSRRKLHTKMKNFKKEILKSEEESWYHNIINKVGFGKNEDSQKEHKGFTTNKNK